MKNKTLFILLGIVLLCCCVLAIGGFVVAPIIQKYLSTTASGLQNFNPAATSSPDTGIATNQPSSSNGPVDGGLGNTKLKTDVWSALLNAESGHGCSGVTSTAIKVVKTPNSSGMWVEDWSANACGKDVVFEITFTLDATGATYDVKQIK